MILSPFWPLIVGCHPPPRRAGRVPVLDAERPEDFVAPARESPRRHLPDTPNNPTGRVYSAVLEAIAAFARDLWIWSDEVYEGIVFDRTAPSMAGLRPSGPSPSTASRTLWHGESLRLHRGPTAEIMASVRRGPPLLLRVYRLAARGGRPGAGTTLAVGCGPHYGDAGRRAADRLGLPHRAVHFSLSTSNHRWTSVVCKASSKTASIAGSSWRLGVPVAQTSGGMCGCALPPPHRRWWSAEWRCSRSSSGADGPHPTASRRSSAARTTSMSSDWMRLSCWRADATTSGGVTSTVDA